MNFRRKRKPPAPDPIKMSIQLPKVPSHPNRLDFEGCLTLVDLVSDKAPSGARGHRVILTRKAAAEALPTLLGMAIGFRDGWSGHNARQKCGIITAAVLEEHCLMVTGYIFCYDFPEIAGAIGDGDFGMSYELKNGHVLDMTAKVWEVTRASFTGAAILLRDHAAYKGTSFRITGPLPVKEEAVNEPGSSEIEHLQAAELGVSLHVILSIAGYFVFASAVGAMPEPTEAQSHGFYGWFFRFCQNLAANANRLAATRFPQMIPPTPEGSATIQRHLEVTSSTQIATQPSTL